MRYEALRLPTKREASLGLVGDQALAERASFWSLKAGSLRLCRNHMFQVQWMWDGKSGLDLRLA